MRVKIIRKEFSGVEFCPEMRVLHLGGQSSANVERLYFELPEEWQGKSVTLHIQQQDGTLPAPILLDENQSCAVGKAFTAAKCGSWMLLALGEDGYRALTRPTKYDCYETLATDGDAEISPTQYETFVAQVLAYANSAQSSAKEARNSAASAKKDAAIAQMAQNTAQQAAGQAVVAQQSAESDADRAEAAAERAELTAPSDGAVRSVNGKGGVVTLTANDLGAVPEDSGAYVKAVRLVGQTLTLTFGDGSTQTLQTKDTTSLENMTGILSAEHGGTGKSTPMTAADVGAVEEGSTAYVKNVALNGRTLTLTLGSGEQISYTIPTATADTPGLVKVGENLSVTEDGTLNGVEGGYSKEEIDSKLQRLERMMNMDGKLVFSGAGVCTGGTTTMTIPSTVDYVEVVSAIPAMGRNNRGASGASNSWSTSTAVGSALGVSADFGHAKVSRGGTATVALTSLAASGFTEVDNKYGWGDVKFTGESADVSLISLSFAEDGTLSISGGNSANRFTVYGYQYL